MSETNNINEINEIKIPQSSLEHEMRTSFLDYAMSVIVDRALPDVRDGCKPVHRRILYVMNDVAPATKATVKSARIVGDVMGKYHPHGDSSIYEAMVRMGQDFSMGEMLVQGQGNFGSRDGDKAAAMRYTEARLSKLGASMMDDLDKDTVDWQPNFDGTLQEPVVLPTKFPNFLVNGGSGIAVGMATNVPTYNLGEICNGILAILDNPQISDDELFGIIPGPDFPTGAVIMGRAGAYKAHTTGRGSIIVRAKTHSETFHDHPAIVVDEIPYQVNKSQLIMKIAELSKDKRIEGISEIRDESSKEGLRIVIELKRDAIPDVVLNHLFQYTEMQTNFPVNMMALNRGRPMLFNIRGVLDAFIDFRCEVIRRRTIFDLNRARNRAHTHRLYRYPAPLYRRNYLLLRVPGRDRFHPGQGPPGAGDRRHIAPLREQTANRVVPRRAPPALPFAQATGQDRRTPRPDPRREKPHPAHLGSQRRRKIGLPKNGRTVAIHVAVRPAGTHVRQLPYRHLQGHIHRHRRRAVYRGRPEYIQFTPHAHEIFRAECQREQPPAHRRVRWRHRAPNRWSHCRGPARPFQPEAGLRSHHDPLPEPEAFCRRHRRHRQRRHALRPSPHATALQAIYR